MNSKNYGFAYYAVLSGFVPCSLSKRMCECVWDVLLLTGSTFFQFYDKPFDTQSSSSTQHLKLQLPRRKKHKGRPLTTDVAYSDNHTKHSWYMRDVSVLWRVKVEVWWLKWGTLTLNQDYWCPGFCDVYFIKMLMCGKQSQTALRPRVISTLTKHRSH